MSQNNHHESNPNANLNNENGADSGATQEIDMEDVPPPTTTTTTPPPPPPPPTAAVVAAVGALPSPQPQEQQDNAVNQSQMKSPLPAIPTTPTPINAVTAPFVRPISDVAVDNVQKIDQHQQQQQQQHAAKSAISGDLLKEGLFLVKRHDENTETWRWVLHNVSHLPMRLYSDSFIVGGHKWRILLFPRGNQNSSVVSVYLDVADSKEMAPGWTRFAHFGLSIVNLDDPSKNIENESERRFNSQENDWGFRELALSEKVYDPSQGFYKNDTLVLETTVMVRKEAHLLNPANYDSKRETGFVGLRNQGATCYLNSLLQTLYHIPEFRRGVYRMPTEDCDNPAKSIPLALQRVFWRLQFTNTAVDTKELTQSFGWDTLDSFMQHDVQELARVLCDNLEEKMKKTAVEGTIPRLFKGEIKNYIKCVNIDFESTRIESFYDLQLNVKGCSKISDSFDRYIEEETLDGDNRYAAEGHGLQVAKKGSIFVKLPPVLMLHLKRFEYDFQRDAMYKINDHYKFDLEIDLNKYVENATENSSNTYNLFSVLVHSGDVSGGHYYAFVHSLDDKSQWFKFDDDKVFHVLEKDAVEDNFGGEETRSHIFPHKTTNLPFKRFSNAYMLVYIKKSEIPHILQPVSDEEVPAHLRTRFEHEKDADDRRRREKAEAHKYIHFRIITDRELSQHEGADLTTMEGPVEFKLRKSDTIGNLKQLIFEKLKVPTSCQRLWKFESRQNRTFRPDSLVPDNDNAVFEKLFHLSIQAPDNLILYLEVPRGFIKLDEPVEEAEPSEDTPTAMQVEPTPVSSAMAATTPASPPWLTALETPPALAPLLQDSAFIFFKYFDPTAPPGRKALRFVGPHLCSGTQTVRDLFPVMRTLAKLPESKDILVYEELKPNMIEPVDLNIQLKKAELQHGDILVFQCAPTPEEDGSKLQLIPEYYAYLFNRRTVRFSQLMDSDPTHEIQIELLRNMTFQDVVEHLGAHIHIPPAFIRLTGFDPLHNAPRATPFKTTDVKTLKDMLHIGQGQPTDRLFFEVLKMPLRDLENKRSLQVSWFNSKVEEVTKVPLLLPKDCTVSKLVEELREILLANGHISDVNVPIHVMEIWQSKITKIFPPEERIDMIYPTSITLRAEEALDETNIDPSKGDRTIQIQHFSKDSLSTYRHFGNPFFIVIGKEDTGADVRGRVKQKLGIPDEEFEHWKLALLRFNKAEYIQDQENVNEVIRKFERYRPEVCLGFEHKDTSARATTATRWYDKAIKIYN